MERNKLPHEPRHLGVPSGVCKMISEPMVCLARTVHLSLSDTKTISKRAKKRFHMTRVALEFHRMDPKWYWSLWYVRCKPCTYLASRLALSPNGPTLTQSPNGLKRDSTRPTSPGSSTMCVQNNFRAYGLFGANRALILHQHWHYLQTDQNEDPHDPHNLVVPSGASKMIFEPMVCPVQTMHLSCVKISHLQMDQNELPLEPRHLGVPSGASKMIYETMVCLPRTVHQSYANINIVSTWTETRFHLSLMT
jgi:hypothetical protein